MSENDKLEITDSPLISKAASVTSNTTTTINNKNIVNIAITSESVAEKYQETSEDNFYFSFQDMDSNNHQNQTTKDREFYLIKHNIPLRPKINQIQYRITTEINNLQNIFNELKSRNEEEIKKLVVSTKENNIQHSSLISSELIVIRSTSRAIWTTKIVLDELYTEICNISSFKGLVETITPLLSVIKNIRSLLIPHIREPEHEFKNIADLLCDILFNAGQIGGHLINFKLANNRALNILNEALFKAEDKIKKEFLPIPNIIT